MQFNEKLKLLRKEKGISQAALAERIYVSRSAVAKWENGHGLPSEESLNMLAAFFGVAAEELLSDPVNETVIVAKNKKLTKQKIWILILSGILFLASSIAIAFTVLYANNRRLNFFPEPIFTQELIFATERETNPLSFIVYGDGELADGKEFSASRTFEIKHGVGELKLPQLLLRKTVNGAVTYESVKYENVVIYSVGPLSVRKSENEIYLLPTDYYLDEFDGRANLKYGDLVVSVRIERHRITAQSVAIRLDDGTNSVGLARKKLISAEVFPYNADGTLVISIEKIMRKDGSQYTGDLSDYAKIENHYLTVSETAEIGARIHVTATTVKDNVKSDELIVEVVRVPIENFNLRFEDLATNIDIGESRLLTLLVRPSDATFNVLKEEAKLALLTPDIALLEQTEKGWRLTVTSDKNAVGKNVSVRVEADGLVEDFSWDVSGIPVENVVVMNADTNEELQDVYEMSVNESLRMIVKITPENATYDKISYNAWADTPQFGRYFSLSDDGVLTVFEKAPAGLEIFVGVYVGRKRAKLIRIVVRNPA